MSCLSSWFSVDCLCVKSLQGWDKDKFSGLNSSDERHLRLLTDAVLEVTACFCFSGLFAPGSTVLQVLPCHVCPLMSSWFSVDCFCVKSLQGWDKDKFSGLNSSDERHLRLLTDAILNLFLQLHVFALAASLSLVQKCCKCFHVMFVLLCPLVFQLIVFCVKSLQGWDKDKFSGLNSSDERHLRLLTDAILDLFLHVFALAACMSLVQKCCKCFHVMFVLSWLYVLLVFSWLFFWEEFARMRQR